VNMNPKSSPIRIALAVAGGLAASTIASHAQGIIANATLVGVPGAGGTYDYTLTLSDGAGATSSIESLWYAWIPGHFFLPTTPSSASGASSGWTASVVGGSIQFQGNAGNAIAPGQSASFTFVTTDSPATLAGNSQGFPIGESVAYAGAVDASSPSDQFAVASVVPEPSSLALLAAGSVGLLAAGRRKLRK
jgi:hypothetical protein